MATTTTNLSLRKPESTDVVNVALDIAASMQNLDDKWASSAAADIGAAAAAGSALTVARTDHVHKVGSGTVSAPGLAVGESNTGLYRIGTSELGVAIAGVLIATVKAIGLVIETAFTGKQIATPAAPAAGYTKLYTKSDGKWYRQTGAGDEILMLDADMFTAAGDLPYYSADETPAVLAIGAAGTFLQSTGTAPSWGVITTAENDLGGDVAMNNAANFFDGPSVSLTAGTWLIYGSVHVTDSTGATTIVAKLWDGSTVESSAAGTTGGAAFSLQLSLAGVVSPGSTTTYKISCRDVGFATGTIKAATSGAGQGNNASHIRAIKIG